MKLLKSKLLSNRLNEPTENRDKYPLPLVTVSLSNCNTAEFSERNMIFTFTVSFKYHTSLVNQCKSSSKDKTKFV